MRVGKWHILGPKSHVSIASLVGRILAVTMEIWNHECGAFRPNFAIITILCHIRITISPLGTEPSQEGGAIIVAYVKGLNAIEFRICSSGSSGVIQLLVRSMIPPFAPHAAFCPRHRRQAGGVDVWVTGGGEVVLQLQHREHVGTEWGAERAVQIRPDRAVWLEAGWKGRYRVAAGGSRWCT